MHHLWMRVALTVAIVFISTVHCFREYENERQGLWRMVKRIYDVQRQLSTLDDATDDDSDPDMDNSYRAPWRIPSDRQSTWRDIQTEEENENEAVQQRELQEHERRKKQEEQHDRLLRLLLDKVKRGSGRCISSCLGGGMTFVRCKTMCHW